VAQWINGYLLRSQLSKKLRGEDEVHLWTSLPTALPVIGKLNEKTVTYYCGDDFNALAGVDHRAVAKIERKLIDKADIVFVASEALKDKFELPKTHVIPHGVDMALFSNKHTAPADLPKGKPIAGFYGAIADWIDVGLLTELAQQRPDWNFVLIGPQITEVGTLRAQENVFFLGPKNHHELAAYVQHWQVSLLPFKSCEQIAACNPLKLREYLAMGKPIVSIDFPALNPYRDYVEIVSGVEQFSSVLNKLSEVQKAHPDIADEQEAARRKSVSCESWQQRAKDVFQRMKSLEGV
jgi:glycosyltransferase involved in cell wall biosynthesis